MKRFLQLKIFFTILFMGSVGMTADFKENPVQEIDIPCPIKKILGAYADDRHWVNLYNRIEQAGITLREADLMSAEEAIRTDLQREPRQPILKYLLARSYFNWAIFYAELKEDKKLGKQSLEKALSAVKESIDLNDSFSDSYRLAGDIYGWLIDFKGQWIFGPFYGPLANYRINQGYQINTENPEIYLAQGRSYIYTPFLFGGSTAKGLDSFYKALEICPDYYQAYLWIGEAHLIRGEKEKAEEAFHKALALSPQNSFVKFKINSMRQI